MKKYLLLPIIFLMTFFISSGSYAALTLVSSDGPPIQGPPPLPSECVNYSEANTPLCLDALYLDDLQTQLNSRIFSCLAYPQRGTIFVGSETEPHLAVNPTDNKKVSIYWQQDRTARLGGGIADVLAYTNNADADHPTFTLINPLIPNTRCSGGLNGTSGGYDRASDPWLAYDKNGILFAQSLNFDGLIKNPSGAIAVARITPDLNVEMNSISTESVEEVVKKSGTGGGVPLLDKNSLTVDPYNNPVLYSVWSLGTNKSDVYFSKSQDSGKTWSARKKIYTTESDTTDAKNSTYSTGVTLFVMPDKSLVVAFNRFSEASATHDTAFIQSFDGGINWTKNVFKTPFAVGNNGLLIDPKIKDASGADIPIRASDGQIPALAISGNSIYVAYQSFNNANDPATSTLKLAKTNYNASNKSWTVAKTIDVSTANAILPTLGIAPNGTIGLLYIDFTNYNSNNDTGLSTGTAAPLNANYWLKQYSSDLTKGLGTSDVASIDFRQAPLLFGAGGVIPGGYFLGDYFGLAGARLPTARGYQDYFFIAIAKTTGQCALDIPAVPNAVAINNCNRDEIYFDKIKANK